MNKPILLLTLAWERLLVRLFPVKPGNKVGSGGLWVAGDVEDLGDLYVAYITVNGAEHAVAVRGATKKTAVERRDFLVAAAMQTSRGTKPVPAVQLIARTEGDKTVEVARHQ